MQSMSTPPFFASSQLHFNRLNMFNVHLRRADHVSCVLPIGEFDSAVALVATKPLRYCTSACCYGVMLKHTLLSLVVIFSWISLVFCHINHITHHKQSFFLALLVRRGSVIGNSSVGCYLKLARMSCSAPRRLLFTRHVPLGAPLLFLVQGSRAGASRDLHRLPQQRNHGG